MRLLVTLYLMSAAVLISRGQQLYEIPAAATQTRWSTFENLNGNAGSGGKENKGAKGHAFDILDPHGQKSLLDVKGAGVITRMWLTVNERSPQMLRSMRIEMFWDNETRPAVSAPLGDFFGIGLGRKTAFQNEFFSDPEGRSFNCYIPMPYKTGARVVITNDSSIPVTLFYDINFLQVAKHEKPVYYFHCFWSRENKTKLERDF